MGAVGEDSAVEVLHLGGESDGVFVTVGTGGEGGGVALTVAAEHQKVGYAEI